MSLIETSGDLWSYVGTHRIIVPTNTLGVMGAGLARQAKEKYPGIQDAYQKTLATLSDRTQPTGLEDYPDLLLVPTKIHYRDPSPLSLVITNIRRLALLGGGPYAMPEIGCGLGGLRWFVVRSYIAVLENVPAEWVVVHTPGWELMR